MNKVEKRVALITGANKGIGFETARQLGLMGYTVFVGARNQVKGDAAVSKLRSEEIDANLLVIDPTDRDSVQNAVRTFKDKFDRLDVLINNAGIFSEGDRNLSSEVPTQVLRETYELNVFGLHEVTISFWGLLNNSKAARLVNVSSKLGSIALHCDGSHGDFKAVAYDSSKAAVNMLTVHYAHQWKSTPHRANAIHPGSVKTDMNKSGELTLEQGAKTSVRLATIGNDGPNGGFFYMQDSLPW